MEELEMVIYEPADPVEVINTICTFILIYKSEVCFIII